MKRRDMKKVSREHFVHIIVSDSSLPPCCLSRNENFCVYMYQIISDENKITCFIIIQQIMLILIAAFICWQDKSWRRAYWKLWIRKRGLGVSESRSLGSPVFNYGPKESCLYLFNYLLFANSTTKSSCLFKGNYSVFNLRTEGKAFFPWKQVLDESQSRCWFSRRLRDEILIKENKNRWYNLFRQSFAGWVDLFSLCNCLRCYQRDSRNF